MFFYSSLSTSFGEFEPMTASGIIIESVRYKTITKAHTAKCHMPNEMTVSLKKVSLPIISTAAASMLAIPQVIAEPFKLRSAHVLHLAPQM